MKADRKPGMVVSVALALGGLWLPASATGGAEPELDPARVAWSRLVFAGQRSVGQVTTAVELKVLTGSDADADLVESPHPPAISPDGARVALMSAQVEAILPFKRKNWTGRTWFRPADGAALQRIRYKPGKDGSNKTFRYSEGGVYRIRAEPRGSREVRRGPERWTDVRASYYPYGASRGGCPTVSDPFVLLYVASAAALSGGDELSACVFNKKGLYRARLKAVGTERVRAHYVEGPGKRGRQVDREAVALKVLLRARPVPGSAGKLEAFEFMGFEGGVEILLDTESGIPLEIRGMLPEIGQLSFRLIEATVNRPLAE